MTTIRVDQLSLTYRIRSKPSLARSAENPTPNDLRIVSKGKFKFVSALEDVSFSLKPGDRLGLVGKNGAGKTTLLKTLYGIYPPTSGTVDVQGRTDALFNINLGFRKEASGRRNIVLRGLINGWSPEEISERMGSIIEFSELGDFIDLPFKTYSQGMAARLAFAIATAMDPQILLMDEWIGAGDAGFREKANDRMQSLTKNAGIIVLATHNTNLIRSTCNKILVLDQGRVVEFHEDIEDYEFDAAPLVKPK